MYVLFFCVWTFTQVSFHPPPPSLLSICSVCNLSLFYPFPPPPPPPPPPPSKRHKWMSPMLFVLLDKEVVEELVDKID